ncbi:MAG: Hpt domain-containing protein [Gammaproteobacteria bacterium]
MSTYRKVDPSTLGWVKSEIDETLKQARLALEGFVENPADRTRLRFCVTHLHQVVGTLLMVELDGAAWLAREVESLAEAVLEEKTESSDAVLETLTHGILVLPEYLARLQYGHPDVPLRHLALMNQLRAARKAPAVEPLELFDPDLSVRPPPAQIAERLSDIEYAARARTLRAEYQTALLAWLRGPTDPAPLNKIAAVVDELKAHAPLSVLEQLFWAAGGLLEALIDGGLEATSDRKKHLARLDQQIKKIIDGGEKSALRSSSEHLVRALLFDIGQARGNGERVTQLKRAFNLELLLGTAAHEETTTVFDLPTPEVLESVAKALGKEIEQAQDMLSTAFETQPFNGAALSPLAELLHKMSGTLDMLGVDILRALVDELTATCQALINGGIARPAAASMPMAQALLLVESGARDIHQSSTDWKQQIEQAILLLKSLQSGATPPTTDGIEVADAELTDGEFRQLLGVVGDEIGVNLAKVEEALEAFAASPNQPAKLDEVPKQLGQIQGALQILGLERAVVLAGATKDNVEAVRTGRLAADNAVLDGLAVCVGTIGAYVEGLRAGRKNLDALLDTAGQEMAAAVAGKSTGKVVAPMPRAGADDLRGRLDAWLADPRDTAAAIAVHDSLNALTGRDDVADRVKAGRIAADMLRLMQIVADDPAALSAEVRQTLIASCSALAEASAPAKSAPAKPPVAAPKPPAAAQTDEEFDEEIMQIFVEDARDVYGNITREFATWRTDTANASALAELRRGYHTLKGSGRMVGASDIAELAWAIENMLNHVRDGKIPATPAVIDVVERSQAVLPAMIATLEGGPKTDADIDGLREAAHALAEKRAPVASAASASPPPELPRVDGALLEIFTNEARGHVANVRQELSDCRSAGACLVSSSLTRSIHTLQGNARSLGIRMMAEACAETERLLHALSAQNLPLTGSHLDMLDRFATAVDELIDAVNGKPVAAGLAERFGAVREQAHGEHEQVALPEPAAGDDQPLTEEIELLAPDDDIADPEPAAVAPAPMPAPAPAAVKTPTSAAAHADLVDAITDPELFEIFQEEAVDILNHIESSVRAWRAQPDDRAIVPELKRALHTLKGGARMAGAMVMGHLSHITESLLLLVEGRSVAPSPPLFDLLEETHDALVSMLDRLAAGEPAPDIAGLSARLNQMAGVDEEAPAAPAPPAANDAGTDDSLEISFDDADVDAPSAPVAALDDVVEVDPPPAEPARAATVVSFPERATPAPRPAEPEEPALDRRDGDDAGDRRGDRRGQVRVQTHLLNELVNYAGEVSISRARMEQQIYGFRDNLAELNRNVVRFRDQLRELEIQSESQILYRLDQQDGTAGDFDPLEFDRFSKLQQLTRSLTESLHDLSTIQMSMGNFVGEAETVLQQQARINTELQEGLMRTRMVDFSTQAARLRHIVRQTSRELGKRAELVFEGSEVQIDRTVLERMIGPFEHMIRNSLDHGIESEDARRKAGKAPHGTITIATAQEGSEVVIRFSDDGAGINLEAIRAKAIERGLLSADANVGEDELLQFILLAGFSTAAKVTQVSGRGVGMDVVHSEIKQLGGHMAVETRRGEGTSFTIRLPLTLSIAQALMVYVGDQQFAVPLASVINIIEYPVEQLSAITMGKNPLLKYNDQVYSYMNLAARLGISSGVRNARKVPMLLARAGNREVAIQIDGLGGTREIVIKTLGSQLAEIKGLAGATILGDGRVVLILDIPGLWYGDEALRVEHRPIAVADEPKSEARERPVVMVVDDSLTVRKVTGKHLQKRGFDVMVAKDGLDAVEQLRDRVPDIMLVDIEMPRMDGYELTSRVRAESRLKHIPIIMITSRAGTKHRQRAFDLGVDTYMSKPYQEQELFENIDTLLKTGRPERKQ